MDRDSIVTSGVAMANFVSPPATLTQATPPAFLARPFYPHANWRGLPDDAVASVLIRLPVLDLFRLGYLFSPRWFHIWRAQPLILHDRQFTTPPIVADHVADAITNVLELHVGDGVQFVAVQGGGTRGVGAAADEGVITDGDIYGNDDIPKGGYEIGRVCCFQVETTRWRPEHLGRWCAALQRGRARVVVLANLAIPRYPDLPPDMLDCTSLLGLHLFFFTVQAHHIDSLFRLRSIGLYGCNPGPGLLRRVLHPESGIQEMRIHHVEAEAISVAATRLRYLMMYDNQVGTVAVDDAIQLRDLYLYPTRPSRLTINRAPRLRRIASLDIFNTVLEIQGIVIQAGMVVQPPQMPSVRCLGLRVNYTQNMGDRVPRQIDQVLRSFPCVNTLEIMRDDDVTLAEGLLEWNDEHIYKGLNFFDGLESINHHLRWIYLRAFRGGKYEVALIKAIHDKARTLTLLRMEYSPAGSFVTEDTLNQLDLALRIFKLHTPNDAVRGDRVSIVAAKV